MPDAPTSRAGSPGLGAVTRKLGPLPVWAWAAVIVLGFLVYRHLHGGGGGSPATAQAQPNPADQGTTDQAYVPGFDAASGAGGGGIGSSPGSVYNYYYGDQAAGQASGGGTSTGVPQRRVDPPVGTFPAPPPIDFGTPGQRQTSPMVPSSTGTRTPTGIR